MTLKLSASKVDTFLGCRRLFAYRHLRQPFVPPENRYFAIGNLAHTSLEYFHDAKLKDFAKGEIVSDPQFMKLAFKAAYKKHEPTLSRVLSREDVVSVKSMLQMYLNKFKGQYPTTVFIEKYFSIDMKDYVINGRADRVDVDGNTTIIVDYKSGKPFSKSDAHDSVQLPTYALWVSRLEGMPSDVTGRYLFLKHLDKRNGVMDIEITPDMVDSAVEKYNYVHSELTRGCKFKRNSSYKYCLFCDFRNHCFSDNED